MAYGGRKDDEFDRLVLDEDFVRGANVTELDAKARRKDAKRHERASRRQARRAQRRRALRSAKTGSLVMALIAVALFVPGLAGIGPLSYLQDKLLPERDDSEVKTVDGAAVTSVPGEVTSTTIDQHLQRLAYDVGDCVFWDGTDDKSYTLDTDIVDCDKPHVLEITGRHVVVVDDFAYPSESFWDAMFDTGVCLTKAEEYLGTKLDPNGNYYSSGVMPSPESWADGDREVYCGIAVQPYEAAAIAASNHAATTGRVAADHQYRIYGIGSCLGTAGSGAQQAYGAVPCDQPHEVEVAGHIDLRGRVSARPAEDAYAAIVGRDCDRLGRQYAGANYRDPVSAGWMWIQAASWDAGQRTVLCTVAEYRNGEAATITRRLGA